MRSRRPSETRHITKTGHRPIPEPLPVIPGGTEPPLDLSGLALEFWHDYVEDRQALGVWTKLDRTMLILTCRTLMRAEFIEEIAIVDIARRMLGELLATPAMRLKVAAIVKPKSKQEQRSTSAIGRSLDVIIGGKRSAG